MTAHISDLLAAEVPGQLYVSFEFFPPRTEAGEENLIHTHMPQFVKQSPVFLDVTWGAGGRTSSKTMALCRALQSSYPHIPVNMHITCTNMPKNLISEALEFAKANNITNIVALRGDPPADSEYVANPDGFECALDLVRFIRATYGDFFCITVAGYPEGHPSKLDERGFISEENYDKELEYLKAKVEAGANLIITQLFYDAQLFIKFVKRCRAAGITVPILPGMLPVTSYASLTKMISLCKTNIPTAMQNILEELKENPEELQQFGVEQNVQMIEEITAADVGVHHFHFYTINTTQQTFKVLEKLHLFKE